MTSVPGGNATPPTDAGANGGLTASQTGQTGANLTGGQPTQQPTTRTGQSINTLEDALAALENARQESAERGKKLKAYETQEATRQQAALSDVERAQAQAAEATKKLAEAESARRLALVQLAVEREASTLGLTSDKAREIAFKAIKDEITYDETGNPNNVGKLLAAIVKDAPGLTTGAQTSQQTALGAPPRGSGIIGNGPLTITRAQLGDFAFQQAFTKQYGKTPHVALLDGSAKLEGY